MKYLFARWANLKKDIIDKYIILFLDYDGTLTPIADTPHQAIIAKETKALLEELTKSLRLKIAIISGRSLRDIKNLVGLKDIIYAGNHGLEIEGPKIKFDPSILLRVNPERSRRIESPISPRYRAILEHIKSDLAKKLSSIKGVLIEDKGLTISVHYRLVDKKDIQGFLSIFNEFTDPYTVSRKIKINSGKKVYEIRPPVMWDKGKVVLWLLARQQYLIGDNNVFPIYIGDDVTDEDAFRVLKNKGLTIFVGKPGISEADYYLKNIEGVEEFMRRILGLRKNRICQN